MNEENPLVFIYFSGRGKFQPVRNLVSYIGCPFYQVHLNNEETKKNLPENIKNCLKKIKFDKNSLPALVHNGYVISDTFPIMSYLCRNFDCSLFGNSIRQRARVNQLLQNMIFKQRSIMEDIFEFAKSCPSKKKEEVLMDKKMLFEKLMTQSGFLKEICLYIENQQKQNTFALGDITIIDFYFMEICLRILGIFKDIEEKKYCAIKIFFKGIFNYQQKSKLPQNTSHLKTMIKYLDFMRSQPFYKKNQKFLEQFTLICPNFQSSLVESFRKLWNEDPIYIK